MTAADLGIVEMPPEADGEPVDWVEVHALLTGRGRRVHTRTGARRIAIARLTALGWTAAAVATHIGVAERTVQRYRAEAGAA